MAFGCSATLAASTSSGSSMTRRRGTAFAAVASVSSKEQWFVWPQYLIQMVTYLPTPVLPASQQLQVAGLHVHPAPQQEAAAPLEQQLQGLHVQLGPQRHPGERLLDPPPVPGHAEQHLQFPGGHRHPPPDPEACPQPDPEACPPEVPQQGFVISLKDLFLD